MSIDQCFVVAMCTSINPLVGLSLLVMQGALLLVPGHVASIAAPAIEPCHVPLVDSLERIPEAL